MENRCVWKTRIGERKIDWTSYGFSKQQLQNILALDLIPPKKNTFKPCSLQELKDSCHWINEPIQIEVVARFTVSSNIGNTLSVCSTDVGNDTISSNI